MTSCHIIRRRPLKIQQVLFYLRQGYATSTASKADDVQPPEVTGQEDISSNLSPVPVRRDPDLYRGIIGRAGVKLDGPLGNQYKPDPLLRQQLTAENQYEILAQTMTPLADIPYEDQLKFKWQRNKKLVVNISRTLAKKIPMLYLDNDSLMCPVDPIVPSVSCSVCKDRCMTSRFVLHGVIV